MASAVERRAGTIVYCVCVCVCVYVCVRVCVCVCVSEDKLVLDSYSVHVHAQCFAKFKAHLL